ncbi:MAG: class II aldolase family protein [Candidatus Omnitrophica bacterium CG07_land_8_20_14_0_80_42_15]|uniref:Class II aldolase family protein n=1 Tax=Candidatus Aquitaenariimonas noxiae TaxID=1974741 RepID=A0A2J0L4L9_9BACT|nr:MAG: class II aldolase family protein [Candidatus Omnitrophica bacterium CG07_land_8_20_14_0_80_42_15]
MNKKSIILKDLVNFGKACYGNSLIICGGGNISAKAGSKIYIKREGVSLQHAAPRDFMPISIKEASAVFTGNFRPSKEFRMHLACFKVRPDIGAVIHTHPVFSTAMGNASRSLLKDFTYELKYTMNSEVPCVKNIEPGTGVLAEEVGKKIKNANGVILSNHGIVTVGKTLEEAFNRNLALERAAKVYILTRILRFIESKT